MYKLFVLLLLVGACAQNYDNNDLQANGKQSSTSDSEVQDGWVAFGPKATRLNDPIIRQKRRNEESDLDSIIRQLQEEAAKTTLPPSVEVETCTMKSGEQGECVPYYQCDVNDTIVTDGTDLLDDRSGFTSSKPCRSVLDVCCRLPDHETPKPPATGCGWRNRNGVGSHVTSTTGGEANFGEFPWTVAITTPLEGFNDFLYVGGGSLIHRSIVLTAAHKVANATTLRVAAGKWDSQIDDEQYPSQERDVAEVVVHRNYNKRNLYFDIALLFLSSPVDLAPHIGLACLPRADALVADDTRCIASGWGKKKFGKEGRYQNRMKRVEVPVVERSSCVERLRRTRLGHRFKLHDTFLCAGAPGQDTCTGDGGSPLVCPTETADLYVQHGIVAWGIGCAGASPGVYVDVATLRRWLDGEVTRRGHDPSVYSLD